MHTNSYFVTCTPGCLPTASKRADCNGFLQVVFNGEALFLFQFPLLLKFLLMQSAMPVSPALLAV